MTSPTISSLDATRTVDDNAQPFTLDADVTLADADYDALNGGAGDYDGALLTVSRAGGASADDVFAFAAMSNLTDDGQGNLLLGGQVVATYTLSAGTISIRFTHAQGAVPTTALVNEVARSISYYNPDQSLVAGASETVTLLYRLADDSTETQASLALTRNGVDSDDLFIDTAGDDSIDAGQGNDTISHSTGTDTVDGGAGTDVFLYDGSASDTAITLLIGSGGIRLLFDGSVTSTITNVENFVVTGGAANDRFFGNYSGSGSDLFHGGAGNDSLNGYHGADVLHGDAGDDELQGNFGADQLFGGEGNDTLSPGTMDYTVAGIPDAETLDGGAGTDHADIYFNGVTADMAIDFSAAEDDGTLTLLGGTTLHSIEEVGFQSGQGNDTLLGTTHDDAISGNNGNDVIGGGAGDDWFDGGSGNDTLQGGSGNDRVFGSAGNDLLEGETGQDDLLGGGGADTLYGGDGNDALYGESDADTLYGGAGDDRIDAGATSSTTPGTPDAQLLDGGEGTDLGIFSLANATAGLLADFSLAGGAGTLEVGGTTLISIERVSFTSGAGNDTLAGTALADTLSGGAGDDLFFVTAGSDVYDGGTGTDTLVFDGSAETGGIAFYATGVAYSGDAHRLTLGGVSSQVSTMEAYHITGGSGDDWFRASVTLAYNDSLDGGAGNDFLGGGGGNDLLLGGDGNDTLVGENDADTLSGGTGNDSLAGGAGTDGLNGDDGNDTLMGEAGDDTLFGGIGDDWLDGSFENDVLHGGAGNDTLVGGYGDDIFVIDASDPLTAGEDLIVEVTSAGNDTIRLVGAAAADLRYRYDPSGYLLLQIADGAGGYRTLLRKSIGTDAGDGFNPDLLIETVAFDDGTLWQSADGLAGLLLGSGDADDLRAGAGDEELWGFNGNDTLEGGAGNDRLEGGAGQDSLAGGSGRDTLAGGAGNDSYTVDAQDVIFEAIGMGDDTVFSAFSHQLAAEIEALVLTGAGNTRGTGNLGNNRLTGNSGNNRLDGAGGSDTLVGGLGDDTYLTDGDEQIIEAAAGGIDTVQASATFRLGANLEHLVLTGSGAINGTGNSADNRLTGNDANNLLNGVTGSDTMAGGLGNDSYLTDGGDRIIEAANGGTDTVRASVTYRLGANLEHLVLTGTAAINGTGNSAGNRLTGNSANNVLSGGEGADTLTGGAGRDVFVFNTAPAAGQVDRITDFSVADDTIRLDDAVFGALSRGRLADAAFCANTTGLADDALDRVIYETDTGRLYYDADGSGGEARVLVAVLSAGLALTAADFSVV